MALQAPPAGPNPSNFSWAALFDSIDNHMMHAAISLVHTASCRWPSAQFKTHALQHISVVFRC